MGNEKLGASSAVQAPAVLSVVLEAWWRIAATPGDLVDVLVATASAGLPARTFAHSSGHAVYRLSGTDHLDRDIAEAP